MWHDPAGHPQLLMRELLWDRLHAFLFAGESFRWHEDASGYVLFDWSAKEVSDWLLSRDYPPSKLEQNSLGAWAMDCIFSEIAMRCMGGVRQLEYCRVARRIVLTSLRS